MVFGRAIYTISHLTVAHKVHSHSENLQAFKAIYLLTVPFRDVVPHADILINGAHFVCYSWNWLSDKVSEIIRRQLQILLFLQTTTSA
jgi:hypothetical protein